MTKKTYTTGGQFLLEAADPAAVFTPEDFDETQRMVEDTVRAFIERSVVPRMDEMEFGKKVELGRTLLREAGEAGILMIDIPEAYGGMGSNKATVMLVSELLAWSGSFAVTQGGHSCIGTLPIVYFGTPEQKAKYLPRLATAEIVGAYALTEPGAGSDALAARSTAVLTEDGRAYRLNGTKQYISNAGFADLFIVFAKVGGDKFTAFIVERDTPGLTVGAEERKMGIKGSSTRALAFEDALVPVENVLGAIGLGHVVAFNILNVGRFKLGAGAVGGCKVVLEHAVPYVKERRQFGRPLSDFGLIRAKIADIAARTFVAESMVYRTAGLMDDAIASLDGTAPDFDRLSVDKVEEMSIECSIIKVFASEALAFAADEGVQMLGGAGFCEDYPLERIYRDQRINRIFEGTNEINRMLVPSLVLKRARRNAIPFFDAARTISEQILGHPESDTAGDRVFLGHESRLVAAMKTASVLCLAFAAQKHGRGIEDRQEVLAHAADMIAESYACDSGLLRTIKKARANGEEAARPMADMVTLSVNDAMDRVAEAGRRLLAASTEGDELRTMLAALRRLTQHDPVDRARLHDAIAARVIEAGRYVA